MNILSGVIEPDAGEMRIDGMAVRFADPRAAQAAGVATIFQELDLVPSLDVTANLFLGRELTRAGVLDRGAMRRAARSRLEAVGVEIDVDQPVGELVGRPAADRRHRQGADLRLAHSGHGRADRGADRGGGRAAVHGDARDRRARRRHRLYLAPARGGAARRRPGDGAARRPGRRDRARATRRSRSSCACWSAGRSTSSIPRRSGAFGRPRAASGARALSPEARARRLAGAERRLARGARRRDRRSCRHHGGRPHRAPDRALRRGRPGRWSRRRRDRRRAGAPRLDPRRARARASASSPTIGAAAA